MSPGLSHIDLLKKLISIPATSRNEDKRADFLEETLRGMGKQVKRIHNNLIVGSPGARSRGLQFMLNSHLDTVAPVEGWSTDPYKALHEGEKITGLGSNDAGASVVAMIAAFDQMQGELESDLNLVLVISAEEEVSGSNGISAVLPFLGHLDGVLVGEPTMMRPAVAERGLMVLDGVVTGKAGHAARNEGVNAIYKAMVDVHSISTLHFPDHSDWLPQAGAQVTMISAGTSHNVVPDICRYVVDVRSNDRYNNERMLEIITDMCLAELAPRSTRLNSSILDKGHLLMKTIEACGMEPFGSSTLSDMALIPFPAIKMGPGDSARSHTAGEYILESEIETGVKTYCEFLTELAKIVRSSGKN